MSPRYFDISPEISEKTAVFPGDVPFLRRQGLHFNDGHNLNLSSIQGTLHLGAHADSPNHFHPQGLTMEAQPLDFYFGPCQVVSVSVEKGARLFPKDIRSDIMQPRVLFKTRSFPDPNAWTQDFNSLSPELLDWLLEKKVITVGIDTPSIDPWDSKKLESHAAILKNKMANLEGLILDAVPDGCYWLMALPLKIKGADGSPVRAILVNEDIVWKK